MNCLVVNWISSRYKLAVKTSQHRYLCNNDCWYIGKQSEAKTNTTFSVGDVHLKLTDQYIYLGLLLTEHLDYTALAQHVSRSDNRALSLVITKHKTFGGLPFYIYIQDCLTQWSGVPSVMAGPYGETDSFCV